MRERKNKPRNQSVVLYISLLSSTQRKRAGASVTHRLRKRFNFWTGAGERALRGLIVFALKSFSLGGDAEFTFLFSSLFLFWVSVGVRVSVFREQFRFEVLLFLSFFKETTTGSMLPEDY